MPAGGKPLSNIRPFLADREQDFSFLKESAEKLAGYIKGKLPETAPVYGFCHGDVHSGNVFFAGDKPTLFDFDCMGYGWRAYDICVYAWNETFLDENYIEGSVWKNIWKAMNPSDRFPQKKRKPSRHLLLCGSCG